MTNRFQRDNLFADPRRDIAPGTLLVAAPSVFDSPFEKTVVVVLQNNDEGTFGVVLNRPANQKIKGAWEEIAGIDADDRYLVQGGPIGGPVFAIHQLQTLAEVEIPGGIFVTAGSDKFQDVVEQTESSYRIVFGVAGWQVGQLSEEIESGVWLTLDGDAEQVFDDPEWMWERALRRYGREVLCDVTGIRRLPPNPLVN